MLSLHNTLQRDQGTEEDKDENGPDQEFLTTILRRRTMEKRNTPVPEPVPTMSIFRSASGTVSSRKKQAASQTSPQQQHRHHPHAAGTSHHRRHQARPTPQQRRHTSKSKVVQSSDPINLITHNNTTGITTSNPPLSPPAVKPSLSGESNTTPIPDDFYSYCSVNNNARFLQGLTLAGVASSLLQTVFGLFHVDVFLRVYQLPLQTYATGNLVYSFVNTANDLAGAWLVDATAAAQLSRTSTVGLAGCLYCLCFLSPFYRWTSYSGTHFVISMSLYDTMYSFLAILLGSVVTDNHTMSDGDRVRFMASGKVANLVASFVVARIGLQVFDDSDMGRFRVFLLLLAGTVAILFVISQAMMESSSLSSSSFFPNGLSGTTITTRGKQTQVSSSSSSSQQHSVANEGNIRTIQSGSANQHMIKDDSIPTSPPTTTTTHLPNTTTTNNRRTLRLGRVVRDFVSHTNFRAWIGTEMLLESQRSFAASFLKTFVDRLVLGDAVSRDTCDWFLSLVGPLTQIVSILCYLPIQKFGYHGVYKTLFVTNLLLSATVWLIVVGSSSNMISTSTTTDAGLANSSIVHHPWTILFFLLAYIVLTGAVLSAGFHLAMSDMVLEMKHRHATQHRFDEPSLAGLFMGANALLCKPMESFLPVLAAVFLDEHTPNDDRLPASDSERARWVLFHLLVGPPLIFSGFQLLSWSYYKLTPIKTARMRDELRQLSAGEDIKELDA